MHVCMYPTFLIFHHFSKLENEAKRVTRHHAAGWTWRTRIAKIVQIAWMAWIARIAWLAQSARMAQVIKITPLCLIN